VKFNFLSLVNGRQSFSGDLVNSLRVSIANNSRPFTSMSLPGGIQGSKISEVNTSNGWKKMLRN